MNSLILDVSENLKFKKEPDYLQHYFGISTYMTAIYPDFTNPYIITDKKGNTIGNWLIWSINENSNDSGCQNIFSEDGSKIIEVHSPAYKPDEATDARCPEPDIRLVFSKTKRDGLWVFRGAFKAKYPHPVLKKGRYVNAYSLISAKVLVKGKHPDLKIQLSIPDDINAGKSANKYKAGADSYSDISKEYIDLIKEWNFTPDTHKLTVPAGIEEIYNKNGTRTDKKRFVLNLADIPYVLISGTTGSGKTLFVQSIITSLIKFYTPDNLKMFIFASKAFEYHVFNGTRFLELPVISDKSKLPMMIAWLNSQISKRLGDFSSIETYPHIFVFFDDIAQANMDEQLRKGLHDVIMHGKPAKVHLFIITSSPSSRIIPDEIKACIPYRIAFTTATSHDSRMIIDDVGAEKLKFPGNYIFKIFSEKHVCFSPQLDSSTIEECVGDDKRKALSIYEDEIMSEIVAKAAACKSYYYGFYFDEDNDLDPLFDDAAEIVVFAGKATTTMLQRELKLGYARCSRLMDELEECGVVGPSQGNKARSVLMNTQEWHENQAAKVEMLKRKEAEKAEDDSNSATEAEIIHKEDFEMPIEILPDDEQNAAGKEKNQNNQPTEEGYNSNTGKKSMLKSIFSKINKKK